jgi:hypothetical protein
MPLPSTKSPLRRRTAAALLALLVLAMVAGCGGGDSNGNDGDATALIDKAFDKPVKSADVKLDAEVKIDGVKGFNKPVRIQATGPYVTQNGTLPKLDMDLTIGAQGQGQSVQTGFLSTGDRAFLKFGGEYYEQPKANVDQANKELRSNKGKKTNALGIDPASWVTGAKMQDEAKVAGVQTDHVSAKVDVRKVLADLNGLAKKGANAVGGTTAPKPLTTQQLDEAANAVKDPTFDIYVGKDDGVVHRMSGTLALSVPESQRSSANGITGGSVRFTVDLTKTNGDQKIEAPATSRPIADLSKQLGGAAALGALGGQQGTDTTPSAPPTATTPTPGATGGATTAPDSAAFKRYSDCLDKAKPGDTQALSRCAQELR